MSDKKPEQEVLDWLTISNDDGTRRNYRVHHVFPSHHGTTSVENLGFTSGPDTPLALKVSIAAGAGRVRGMTFETQEAIKVADVVAVVVDEAKKKWSAPPAKIVVRHGAASARPQGARLLVDLLVGRRGLTAEDKEGMAVDYDGWYDEQVERHGECYARWWMRGEAVRLAVAKIHLVRIFDACVKLLSLAKAVKDVWPGN